MTKKDKTPLVMLNFALKQGQSPRFQHLKKESYFEG